MKTVTLIRKETGDEGTFGSLTIEGSPFNCRTLELPWRGNARGVSCFPAGVYLFKWRTDSPKHGQVYEEWDDPATLEREDVPERTNCQIHSANLAGDATQGYVRQLEGCIALGYDVTTFPSGRAPAGTRHQKGVILSREAVMGFATALNRETFKLIVKWAPGVGPKEA